MGCITRQALSYYVDISPTVNWTGGLGNANSRNLQAMCCDLELGHMMLKRGVRMEYVDFRLGCVGVKCTYVT